MKITVEFDNGPTLVLAPEQFSLTQLNAEQIALVGTAGTYAIPIVSFPGSLATANEIETRNAPRAEPVPDKTEYVPPAAGYAGEPY
jgi:hypothetical protein